MIRLCRPFYCDCRDIAGVRIRALKPYQTGRYTYHVKGWDLVDEPRMGSHIGKLRRTLVNDFKDFSHYQAVPFDGYVWWDSDVDASIEDLLHLLELGKKHPFVGLPYPNHSQSLYIASLEKSPGVLDKHFPLETRGLQEVHLLGGGFLWTAREVFEALEYPWWREVVVKQEGGGQDQLNEDWGLCVQARHGPGRKRFRIMCDFDRPVGHGLREHSTFNWKGSTMEQKTITVDEVAARAIHGLHEAVRHAANAMEQITGLLRQAAAENAEMKKDKKE